MATRSTVVEWVEFAAGPYVLEGELAYPEEGTAIRGGVVIAGSHPLLGGTMHNNVVRGLSDGLAERDLVTLRFNYRGIGRSQGPPVDVVRHLAAFWHTSHVPGELDLWQDVQGGVDFLRAIIEPELPVTLIGYSFGCALLRRVQTHGPAGARVLIAPPLDKHDDEAFTQAVGPVLVIAADNDFAVTPARLRRWFDRLLQPRRLVQAPLDNHFFRGHEAWLADTVATFLEEQER